MAVKTEQTGFWPTAIGGFVLGIITVLLVLLLARRTADPEPVPQAPPAAQATQP